MASSNRHWPSLFKSKPSCASTAHHQWQHDVNHSSLLSGHCQKPNTYASGGEERTPEPKPRWNPKPEQIRILEAIFNSGMVNPPRDEIRRIRAQLQVYGQVGDANVFYWFQNRKSRSKNKQRQLKSAAVESRSSPSPSAPPPTAAAPPPPAAASSSTSSSSSRSSSGSDKRIPDAPLAALFDNVPSQKPTYFHTPFLMPELGLEASLFLPAIPQTYSLPSDDLTAGMPSLLGDLIVQGLNCKTGASEEEQQLMEFNRTIGHVLGTIPADNAASHQSPENLITTSITSSGINELQAVRSIVFINEMAYEVTTGPLNIRQAFGQDAVLLNSSGLPVLTDEWGFTLQPLQHGASYYLVQ